MSCADWRAGLASNSGSAEPAPAAGGLAPPGGLALGVAFDWALGFQLLSQALGLGRLGSPPALVVGAAICFGLGEALRRGRAWMRWVQVGLLSLIFLGGLAMLVLFVRGPHISAVLPGLIMLLYSPWVAWRLALPRTARWFAAVSPADALRRHSGRWLLTVAGGSLAGGVLVAWWEALP